MEKISFSARVYSLCKLVPKGKVTTYSEIARKLGTKGYQAIGQVLSRNPYAPIVPCHRVIKSDGSLGGFFGKIAGEIKRKRSLLENESVIVINDKIDLSKFGYYF